MKVICDTNVWYDLADGKYDLEKVASWTLCATYVNISELSKTQNYIDRIDVVREALRQIFKRKADINFYNPLEHIIKLQEASYPINWNQLTPMLQFTEQVMRGHVVTQGMEEIANAFFNDFKRELVEMTNVVNADLEQHRANSDRALLSEKENFVELNKRRIETFVTSFLPSFKFNNGFDWSQLELFHATLGMWIQDLLANKKMIRANDWNDLFILAYVQPGIKYWTAEKKWNRLILESGLGHYLIDASTIIK